MKYNKSDFDTVVFSTNGIKRSGYIVGKHLCISYSRLGQYDSYKVFIISTGKAITGKVTSFDTAVEIAKAYNWLYRDQIFLLDFEDWRERNIPELCQYTIPNGFLWARFWNKLAETDVSDVETLKQKLFIYGRKG